MVNIRASQHLARHPNVVEAGRTAYIKAHKEKIDDGGSDSEADVAGREASLEARKKAIADLMK